MKKFLLMAFVMVLGNISRAQTFTATFTGAAAAIPNGATTQKCFPVNVTGIGNINGTTIGLAQVCLNITHPDVGDIEIVLRAPDGTIVPLSVQNGGAGNNYTGTCFTATATNPIKSGTAPYTGVFLPEGHLGAVNNGQNANGSWSVCVQDRRNTASTGSLTSFSLTFTNTPAPAAPVKPPCTTPLPMTSTCANATSICDFSGVCGTTNGNTIQDWGGSNLGSCFGIENNSFIKFVASATTASFSIWASNSSFGGNYYTGGIQMEFFSGTCGSGAVTSYGCYPHIYPSPDPANPIISVVTASGLTIGNTYYLMIDGFGGDHCQFTIEANSGINILNINPPVAAVCPGGSVALTATGGNGVYSWSPSGTLSASTGSTVTATPTIATTYTVTSVTTGGCPLTKDVTVNINPPPVITLQPSLAPQNVCPGQTATALTITATAGSGTISSYQWYVNTTASNTGGTLIPGATSATYTPPNTPTGTFYYYCVVTNSNTCRTSSNVSGAINILAPLTPPAASVTTQATCTAGGTITVSSPLGANYTYSVNGTTYQASPVFPNLPPNSYNVTVTNTVTGCISAATVVVVNNPSTLTPPAASVTTQATCLAGGTITVSSPLGANYTYSVNGTTYQVSPVFPNLPPSSYNVTVTNIATGCISTATVVVVNNPSTLTPPVASVTAQATCTTGGTITVSSPLGANYTYSVNGTTYQASPVFTNLPATSYNVTVRDITTGCTSNATVLVVNNPSALAPPTASATQPTCVAGGIITISTPLGANYTYSINGTTYQASPVFSPLGAATYNVTVRDITTGCTSTAVQVVLNTPAVIAVPAVSVIQPTCLVPTGSITITSPLGGDYEYRINGGPYQASPVFSGLAPGPYNISTRSISTGCTSANTVITIAPVPILAAPVASATLQPTCIMGGSITVTSPIGSTYAYSIDGINYQGMVIFTGLNPGPYNVTVKDIVTGCVSTATVVTMANPPGAPASPAATTTQPTCTSITGSITVTSPLGAGFQYSIDGTTYQAAVLFSAIAPGTYNLTVKNTATGCISAPTPITINTLPAVPTAPVASVTQQATCANPTGTITITSPIGPNIQYSINGVNYQSSTVFPGLVPNTYNITAKNTVSGCISAITQVTVNPPPNAPATPVAAVTQQTTCVVSGIITITSPLGADLQYSINGTTYQTSPVFNNVGPGSYNVTVKSISTGCVSASVPLVVNAVPAIPATPVASVTKQPTCADKTGTITVTTPLGATLEYSLGSVNWQASPVFSGVAPATTYTLTVRDISTSCQSVSIFVPVAAVPGMPNAPTVNTSPRCGPGVVNLSAAGTGTITWYSDAALTNVVATGITYAPVLNASTIFYVTATFNGCSSIATPVTAEINSLPQPSLGANRTICKGENLVLNPGTFSSYVWQDNSSKPTFTVTASNTYSVQVENIAGCKGTASVQIMVVDDCDDIYFPNAFTPNGDSKNDEFGPLPPNSFAFVTDYNLMIFNRYGQRVFQSNTPAKKWSGKYLGALTPGNYVWHATYKFKGKVKTQKGNILVIK